LLKKNDRLDTALRPGEYQLGILRHLPDLIQIREYGFPDCAAMAGATGFLAASDPNSTLNRDQTPERRGGLQ
jgi:hypothetical protein